MKLSLSIYHMYIYLLSIYPSILLGILLWVIECLSTIIRGAGGGAGGAVVAGGAGSAGGAVGVGGAGGGGAGSE